MMAPAAAMPAGAHVAALNGVSANANGVASAAQA
jgi:hypothetical protein